MDKSRQEYVEVGERGAAMAAKLGYEVEYLSRWLPQKLGESETPGSGQEDDPGSRSPAPTRRRRDV